MKAFSTLTSRTVVLRERNIDTDQIIPARFLTTTERAGLGSHAFNDWRRRADGSLNPEFPFNQAQNAACQSSAARPGPDLSRTLSPERAMRCHGPASLKPPFD